MDELVTNDVPLEVLDSLGALEPSEDTIDNSDTVYEEIVIEDTLELSVDSTIVEVVVEEITVRERVVEILLKEVGTEEIGGNNRGPGPKKYLKSVGLDEGYAWCAALLHWAYTQADVKVTFNAWSPSLFTSKTTIYDAKKNIKLGPWQPGDAYGIYYTSLKRIGHVGTIIEVGDTFVKGVEGNTNEDGSRESNKGDGVYIKYRPNWSLNKVANVIDNQ